VRLAERVHLVASGRLGFSLTDDYDCHVYALDGGDEVALVDAGGGRSTAALLANLRRDGLDPGRVRHLLLTHAHADHAAGAAALREALPGLRVYASREAAPWLRDGDERAISLDVARQAGMYPPDIRLRPCPVDTELADGQELAVGDLRVRAVATPGHARGHLSFLVGPRLFAGDALFFGGRIALQDTWDCSVQESNRSIERLAELAWDALLPGHLTPSLSQGKRHAEVALAAIRKLGVPPPLQV
jgi:glyoxylase-like metal-dependent hydrolase (beta-lactamase superfamily II)